MEQPLPPVPPPAMRAAPRRGPFDGFARAIGFVAGLFVLGMVFAAGLVLGVLTMVAGSMAETPVLTEIYRDGDRNTVAVLPVEGVIDGFQSARFRMFADHVRSTPSIKAVVLRVDSPGGGIAPSDQIWYEVGRLRESGLPVVASYGGLAASGGYYISCASDHIVAEPTCITGSIGVIAQTFIFKDLMDKIGVQPVTLLASDSPEKDLGNPFRTWTDEDHDRYVEMLDAAYGLFNDRVREGRKHVIPDASRVNELADGSIYTASQALDGGLIDSVGYLDDAVAMAESLAGLAAGSSTVVVLHEQPTLLDSLLVSASDDIPSALSDGNRLRSLLNDLGTPRLMYLMR